jgi:hypothetical protein
MFAPKSWDAQAINSGGGAFSQVDPLKPMKQGVPPTPQPMSKTYFPSPM